MSVRRKFDRKIREKEQEIQSLEFKIMEAKAYLQAMQDALRLLPAEGSVEGDEFLSEISIKPGSAMEAAVKALRESGKPMHIMDLLKAIGRDPTPENRASIGGSIAAYVRKGAIFTRTAPNTFGLAEWVANRPADEPPEDFGTPSS